MKKKGSSDFISHNISVRRVCKVVKGGKRFALSILSTVGDGKNSVGFGHGKAKESIDATNKANIKAERNMRKVILRHGRTLPHCVEGSFGASKLILRPALPGTGLIAGGAVRTVLETLGIKDIVVKSVGSNNSYNMVRALFNAFDKLRSPRMIALRRGKSVSAILGSRAKKYDDEDVNLEVVVDEEKTE